MLFLSFFLAGALQITQTSPVVGYTSARPVDVKSCALQPDPTTLTNEFAIRTSGAEWVSISFVNEDSKPATSVSFDVSDGHKTSRIVDTGTFSSGTAINHRLNARDFPNANSSVTCTLDSVSFADGTEWQAKDYASITP